jgi:hypothetical protein
VFAANSISSVPADLPDFHWHLTARPWHPVAMPESELLDRMESAMRALAPCQYWNANDPHDKNNGALIDPIDKKEIQYATPLFAFNTATLLTKGRAEDLLTAGMRALDRSTLNISTGFANDYHGEFFCAPMVKAIRMFEALQPKYPQITSEKLSTWKKRMKAKRSSFMSLKVRQNWRTFAMKGEWLRQQDGYIDDGEKWIETDWIDYDEGHQRERFRRDLDKYHLNPHFFFYHDDTANPETFAYNGATTANLLDMLENGYSGPSAKEMRDIISRNLKASLLMLSAAGEAPGGGRTGEHIWDDSIYANAFELAAQVARREGDLRLAGQYQHAVELLLASHERFQQESGLFSITKNQFPPCLKNRYATWSGVVNYEGFTVACCSETLLACKAKVAEQPAPFEIGGYVMQLDPTFANTFLNAGGMQAQICTRGETDKYGGVQWHTFGITRFSRTGWDGRLGPGAGHVNSDFSDGISFSPTFLENGKWKRVCLEPNRFQGVFEPEFVHPLLVRGKLTIAPVQSKSGPTFVMRITLTPDGALVDTERVSGSGEFGIVWPLFEFDGRTVLNTHMGPSIASTAYPRTAGTTRVVQVGDGSVDKRETIMEWSGLDGGEGGPTTIGFRYALAAEKNASRRATFSVNGIAQPDLVFLSTGGKTSWHQLNVPVTLNSGKRNKVSVDCGDGGEIIDELRVYLPKSSMPEPDQQNFVALKATHRLDASGPAVRGGYGDFRPVRVTDSEGGTVETFVYPRGAGDPDAETVRTSFVRNGRDFSSVLGRVRGTLYIGRTCAGGVGDGIELNNDGKKDVTFDRACGFILTLNRGRISALETDRSVTATLGAKKLILSPYTPVAIDHQ